jgi:L-fuculose-phosphate aldolase
MRSMDRSTAADAIVRAGARLGRRGLIAAGEGNVSCLLDDGSILVTPSGLRKDELDAGDLVLVDASGTTAAARAGLTPTSDLAIHRAVYAARADVRAVAHAHLPASMSLTLAGERPDAAALPETAALLRDVPFVAYGEMGSAELAGRIAAAFRGDAGELPVAVLLERHGAVAVGDHPDTAVDRLELVEVLCRAWRDALLVRAARAILSEASGPGD